MPDEYYVDQRSAEILRDLLNAYRSGHLSRHPEERPRKRDTYRIETEFGKADAQIAAVSTAGHPGSGTVSVWGFTSTSGTSDTGQNITAYNLSTGPVGTDRYVICARHTRSAKWLVIPETTVSASTGGSTGQVIEYAIARRNWSKGSTATPADPYVLCSAATARNSTTWSTTAAFNVYTPRSNQGDPNVVSGDVVAYLRDGTSARVCVSDYMDDPIGSVRQHVGTTATIPAGWGIMDGTENSTANGGSGLSMAAKFVRGTTAALSHGTTGGAATHTHNLDATTVNVDNHTSIVTSTVAAHQHSFGPLAHASSPHTHGVDTAAVNVDSHAGANTSTDVTGLTVAADTTATQRTQCSITGVTFQGHHHHSPNTVWCATGTTGDQQVWDATNNQSTTDPAEPFEPSCTDGGSTAGHSHAFQITGLNVSVSDAGHSHSFGTLTHASSPHTHATSAATVNIDDHAAANTGLAGGHSHTVADLTHATSAHTHATSAASHLPPYRSLYFIERLDNTTS